MNKSSHYGVHHELIDGGLTVRPDEISFAPGGDFARAKVS